jgi:dihydroxyacetone kinase-like predicted kinase
VRVYNHLVYLLHGSQICVEALRDPARRKVSLFAARGTSPFVLVQLMRGLLHESKADKCVNYWQV